MASKVFCQSGRPVFSMNLLAWGLETVLPQFLSLAWPKETKAVTGSTVAKPECSRLDKSGELTQCSHVVPQHQNSNQYHQYGNLTVWKFGGFEGCVMPLPAGNSSCRDPGDERSLAPDRLPCASSALMTSSSTISDSFPESWQHILGGVT